MFREIKPHKAFSEQTIAQRRSPLKDTGPHKDVAQVKMKCLVEMCL